MVYQSFFGEAGTGITSTGTARATSEGGVSRGDGVGRVSIMPRIVVDLIEFSGRGLISSRLPVLADVSKARIVPDHGALTPFRETLRAELTGEEHSADCGCGRWGTSAVARTVFWTSQPAP